MAGRQFSDFGSATCQKAYLLYTSFLSGKNRGYIVEVTNKRPACKPGSPFYPSLLRQPHQCGIGPGSHCSSVGLSFYCSSQQDGASVYLIGLFGGSERR